MKTGIILLHMLLGIVATHAQNPAFEWAKQFGGTGAEHATAATVDAAGNAYTLGSFTGTGDFDPGIATYTLASDGEADIFLCKLNPMGHLHWAKRWGGTMRETPTSVVVDGAGNVYSTGSFEWAVDFDPGLGMYYLFSAERSAFVSKLDSAGNYVWAKDFGGTRIVDGKSIAIDPDGNIYVFGEFGGTADFDPGPGTYNMTATNFSAFVVKLNAGGDFVWAKTFLGTWYVDATGLALDQTNHLYLAGEFRGTCDLDPGPSTHSLTSIGEKNIFLAKLDSAGNFVWGKHWFGDSSITNRSLAIDGDTSIYMAGAFTGTVDFDPGAGPFSVTAHNSMDGYVCKLDANGDFLWAKQFGGNSYSHAHAISVDPAGNAYVAGGFYEHIDVDPGPGTLNFITPTGSMDSYLVKLDPAGNFLWAGQLGDTLSSMISCIVAHDNTHLYAAGSFPGRCDFDLGPGDFPMTAVASIDAFLLKMNQNTVGIAETHGDGNATLQVYPNPTTGPIYVALTPYATLILTNTLGQVLLTQHHADLPTTQLHIPGPPGIYFLTVSTPEKHTTVRVVKQ